MGVHTVWSGVISWGLVNVPVKMGKATADDSVPMHQVHVKDGGRVRYRKYCEACGEELQAADIGRGAQQAAGQTVALTSEDMEGLPQAEAKQAQVQYFCDAGEIDPLSVRTSYYLMPDTGGGKAYRLLFEVLQSAGTVAVCTIAIRSRESLAVIAARGDALMLHTLYWPSEVREEPEFLHRLAADQPSSEAERKMAAAFVKGATQAFDPDVHTDAYSEAVRALVDSRQPVAAVPAGSGTEAAVELMDLLKAQLGAQREAKKAQPRKRARKTAAGAA